jgi:hypothetical protein
MPGVTVSACRPAFIDAVKSTEKLRGVGRFESENEQKTIMGHNLIHNDPHLFLTSSFGLLGYGHGHVVQPTLTALLGRRRVERGSKGTGSQDPYPVSSKLFTG